MPGNSRAKGALSWLKLTDRLFSFESKTDI